MDKFIKFKKKGTYRYGGYPLPIDENNVAEIPLHLKCSRSIIHDMGVRFKLQGEVIGDDASELGNFSVVIPDTIYAGQEFSAPITLKSEAGLDNPAVIKFLVTGSGDVTIKMTDSLGQEFTFTNQGTWGPESGFEVPAGYESTTNCKILVNISGEYKLKLELVDVTTNEVVNSNEFTFEVIEQPVEANLNLTISCTSDSKSNKVTLTKLGKKGDNIIFSKSEILSEVTKLYDSKLYNLPEVNDVTVIAGQSSDLELEVTHILATASLTVNVNTADEFTTTLISAPGNLGESTKFTAAEIKECYDTELWYPSSKWDVTPEPVDTEVNYGESKTLEFTAVKKQLEATLNIKVNGTDTLTLTKLGEAGTQVTFSADEIKSKVEETYPADRYINASEYPIAEVNAGESSEVAVTMNIFTYCKVTATNKTTQETKEGSTSKVTAIGESVTFNRAEVLLVMKQLFPDVEVFSGDLESEYTTTAGTDVEVTTEFTQTAMANLELQINGVKKSDLSASGEVNSVHDFTDQVKELVHADYPEAEYTFNPELVNITAICGGEKVVFNTVPTPIA